MRKFEQIALILFFIIGLGGGLTLGLIVNQVEIGITVSSKADRKRQAAIKECKKSNRALLKSNKKIIFSS